MNLKHPRTQSAVAILTLLFCMANVAAAENTLVFPQFVTGGGYTSVITLVNTSTTATVTGTLSFYNQDGTPRSVAIDGQPTGTSLPGIKIRPGGTVVLSTTPGGTQTIVGMVKFTSDNRAGGVVRFVFAGGQVGVLSASPQSSGILVLNTSGGNDTGVAIANPDSEPVNIRLTYVDEKGTAIETVDPPELNPLPGNGQIAKFVTQMGFKQVSNRDKGSILIQSRGTGQFSAFALLLKDGALSSTAVIHGQDTSAGLNPIVTGTYTGTWTNTNFGSTGGLTLEAGVNTLTRTAVVNLTLTGNVFGGSGGSASLVGAYSLGGFTATGTSTTFGPSTITLDGDGNFTFTANRVPSPNVSAFKMTGQAKLDQITGNYVATLTSGSTANGTISLKQATVKVQ